MLELIELQALSENYKRALADQQKYIYKLIDAQSAVETEKTRVVAFAQNSGAINGANEAARKIQVATVLEESVGVSFLEAYAREVQAELDTSNIEVKMMDVEIGLTKAWLYSKSKP